MQAEGSVVPSDDPAILRATLVCLLATTDSGKPAAKHTAPSVAG